MKDFELKRDNFMCIVFAMISWRHLPINYETRLSWKILVGLLVEH